MNSPTTVSSGVTQRVMPGPSRVWTWTMFFQHNQVPQAQQQAQDLFSKLKNPSCNVKSLSMQLENCPTSGALHLQGFFRFKSPIRQAAAKALLWSPESTVFKSPRLAKSAGTDLQNFVYTQDERKRTHGTQPWVLGSPETKQGERTDLSSLRDEVLASAKIPVKKVKNLQQLLFAERLQPYADKPPRRDDDFRVFVVWGTSGVGKSHAIRDSFTDEELFETYVNQKGWHFDAYRGEPIILIEDFFGNMPMTEFLQISDIYRKTVQVRGRTVYLRNRILILTSNKNPQTWYDTVPGPVHKAVMRRLTCFEVHERRDVTIHVQQIKDYWEKINKQIPDPVQIADQEDDEQE